jgi:RNA polymerase sigma factor (sigma-70 family)
MELPMERSGSAAMIRDRVPSTRSYPELPPVRVALALTGDREAVADVYATYDPAVRAAVVAAIRHRRELELELEDFVSEIWARFLEKGCWRLRKYDPSRAPFGWFLRMRAFSIARQLAGRRIHKTMTVAIDDPLVWLFAVDDPEATVLARNELERVWAVIRVRLDAIDLALFQGVFAEGRLVREIAAELGVSEVVAYRRSHRLKHKLELIVAELLGHGDRGGNCTALVVLLASMLAQAMPGDATLAIEQASVPPRAARAH